HWQRARVRDTPRPTRWLPRWRGACAPQRNGHRRMTWTPASDDLPAEGEPVLLYLPNYEWPRPALAMLRKGDPEAEGDHYRLDSWLCAALRGVGATVQTVQPEHLWARI